MIEFTKKINIYETVTDSYANYDTIRTNYNSKYISPATSTLACNTTSATLNYVLVTGGYRIRSASGTVRYIRFAISTFSTTTFASSAVTMNLYLVGIGSE